jgi:putative tryptophan/tyrosine transport system substrate-binding protein
MRRREFIALTGASVTWPFAAIAQQGLPTLGILTTASPTTTLVVRVVVDGMKEFGWHEGQNYRVLYRFAEGHMDRIPALVDELVAQRVDVIVAVGDTGIQAAQCATKTIPIVGLTADMVRTGLAASMARPGGNLTGVSILASELDAKRLEILHEAVPVAKRIGALALPYADFDTRPELEAAARQLDLELVVITVRSLDELAGALDALQSARVDAVNVLSSPLVGAVRASIIERLNRARLPAIYEAPEFAEQGGFLGYGARLDFSSRLVARLVSKILRGARPEDLPIEQPNRFDLVVNLKTADSLGLKVPPALLVRADKVIE